MATLAATPNEPSLTGVAPSLFRLERLDPEVLSGRRGRLRAEGVLPGEEEQLDGSCGGGEGSIRLGAGLPGRRLVGCGVPEPHPAAGFGGVGQEAAWGWAAVTSRLDAEAVEALWSMKRYVCVGKTRGRDVVNLAHVYSSAPVWDAFSYVGERVFVRLGTACYYRKQRCKQPPRQVPTAGVTWSGFGPVSVPGRSPTPCPVIFAGAPPRRCSAAFYRRAGRRRWAPALPTATAVRSWKGVAPAPGPVLFLSSTLFRSANCVAGSS